VVLQIVKYAIQIFKNALNVRIGAYGEKGEIPKIVSYAGTGQHALKIFNKNNFLIEEIEIVAPEAISCIYVVGNDLDNIEIKACKFSSSEFGIRVIGKCKSLVIKNNHIFNTKDDGIFIMKAKDIWIQNNHIENVNLKWYENKDQSYSAGDCIQLYQINNSTFVIESNILDHSTTGNKFCFIAEGKNYKGIFSKNTFIANKAHQTSCLYLHPTAGNIQINGNWFTNGAYAIYNYSKNLSCYYNVFEHINTVYGSTENARVVFVNNVISNCNHVVGGYSAGKATFVNCAFYTSEGTFKFYESQVEVNESNNAFQVVPSDHKPGGKSVIGDLGMVDPENGNYKLREGSACIDKGMRTKYHLTDYFGNEIKKQDIPDIGIMEYKNNF